MGTIMKRLLFITLVVVSSNAFAADKTVDFVRDVKPILQTHCWKCHGAERQESDLRLDARTALLKGGDSSENVVVPGKSDSSALIKRVTSNDADTVMPPEGPKLTKAQVNILKAWIDQGVKVPAEYRDVKYSIEHWSFQPVKPLVAQQVGSWGNNPVDTFIAQKLTEKGINASKRAPKRDFIRRLYLVELGVPPSLAAIEEFEQDNLPGSYERLVDDVLANPHFGERIGQHWLDLVHFGETHGFETNRERPNAWHYRDYVIGALNHDKPYDQFIREQIAGDATGHPSATGFLVAGPYDIVRSSDINLTMMQRQDELADMINTTGTAFLGLTLGCARCHNHKFDPISQRDYYSIQAVFAGVSHGDRSLPVPPSAQQQLAQLENEIRQLRIGLEEFIPKPAPNRRVAVNFFHNVEKFKPTKAKFVRFTIERTSNNTEPCIDELVIWSRDKNVALAKHGSKATSSGDFPNNPYHKLKHINDGEYGNTKSWISNERGKGWVQIELPDVSTIDRIEWGRDRQKKYRDRLATEYKIEAAVEAGKWQVITSSKDRAAFQAAAKPIVYRFDGLPETKARRGRKMESDLKAKIARRDQLKRTTVVYAGKFSMPGPTHRLYRGDPFAKREEVGPDAIEVLGSLKLARNAPEQLRRVKFAEWLADESNPLTARVIVNRTWQQIFGTGIVDTPSDFGGNGTLPSHPELLDWLANDLMTSGWSLKHIHRLILTSATFQQSSQPQAKAMAIDADTRLLWRFPPRRLEAEAIRDSILAVSGNLDRRMQGVGFSGFVVQMENVRHFFPKESFGPGDWRRMIYMTKVRQEKDDVFGAFDCPDASQVIPERSRSTTPIQSLNLFNSKFVLQQADLYSKSLTEETSDIEALTAKAFLRALGRPASDEELHDASEFARSHGLFALCRALFNSNEFLFIP